MPKVSYFHFILILNFTFCTSPKNDTGKLLLDSLGGRKLHIYLPAGYNSNTKYKVVYLLDGQNIFTDSTSYAGEWHVDETIDSLQNLDVIEPVLAIAIFNSPHRAEEYSPYFDSLFVKYLGVIQWDSSLFFNHVAYLENELFPFIEKKYGASSHPADRAISGASLGGLHTLWWSLYKGNKIGWASIHSPSLWVANSAPLGDIRLNKDTGLISNIWLDIGGDEWDFNFPVAVNLFSDQSNQFYFLEDPNAKHNEKAWGKRWGYFIQLFAGKQKPKIQSIAPVVYSVENQTKEGKKILTRVLLQNKNITGIAFSTYADSVVYNYQTYKDSLGYFEKYDSLHDGIILFKGGNSYSYSNY